MQQGIWVLICISPNGPSPDESGLGLWAQVGLGPSGPWEWVHAAERGGWAGWSGVGSWEGGAKPYGGQTAGMLGRGWGRKHLHGVKDAFNSAWNMINI